MFPAVYAPDIQEGGRSWPNVAAMTSLLAMQDSDPAFARAVDALRGDPRLASLLGDDPELGAFISQDTGMGWRWRPSQIPGAFVHGAARHVSTRALPTDSVEPLLKELERLIPRVRRLVAGEPDEAVLLTAFSGIGIKEGAAIQTPWGVLRGSSAFERSLRPFGNPPSSAVLETTVPLRWKLGEPGKVTVSKELAEAQSDPMLLALAVLLALGRDTPARFTWRTSMGPLEMGRSFGGAPGAPPWPWMETPTPEPLTDEQTANVAAWAERVAALYDPSIAIAVRRTLSAVSERTFDVEDALIDAVIAWENLFGTGSNAEMTFRVTTALAILLEPDPAARSSLRSDLGKVYDLRSKVAHGGEVKAKDKLAERKDQAIDVAIEALRALLEKHPGLVGNSDRGMHIILGLPEDE